MIGMISIRRVITKLSRAFVASVPITRTNMMHKEEVRIPMMTYWILIIDIMNLTNISSL
jgi:hypothetical protein